MVVVVVGLYTARMTHSRCGYPRRLRVPAPAAGTRAGHRASYETRLYKL